MLAGMVLRLGENEIKKTASQKIKVHISSRAPRQNFTQVRHLQVERN